MFIHKNQLNYKVITGTPTLCAIRLALNMVAANLNIALYCVAPKKNCIQNASPANKSRALSNSFHNIQNDWLYINVINITFKNCFVNSATRELLFMFSSFAKSLANGNGFVCCRLKVNSLINSNTSLIIHNDECINSEPRKQTRHYL